MRKLKIAFHIPRMNWYRVLSPLINEAIERGHKVECWHQIGAKSLGENCPNREKMPDFKLGVPVIIDYNNPEDIIRVVSERSPDVIIDAYPPRYPAMLRDRNVCLQKPYWLLVDLPPSDVIMEIKNDDQLYACDGFAICNDFYLNASIRYGMQCKTTLLSDVQSQVKELGEDAAKWVKSHFMYQFKDSQVQYIRKKSIIVGNPSFDDYSKLDRASIRRRLKISAEQKVIVLLPFPFGYDITASWEQLYVRGSLLSRLIWIVQNKRFDCMKLLLTSPSNKTLLAALRRFAENNDALLVAKIRHSRIPAPELKQNCHMLFGDEGYYPHTAVELFAIADLVVGHYSFGSIEAAALGTPFLNVDIPGFPKKYYCDTRTSIKNCDPWPGVVWSMGVSEARDTLPLKTLQEFQIRQDQREEYLRKFASWPLGGASARILDCLEVKLAEN